jgi:DNA polymerase-3 subunit gamma/tau
MSLALYRKYRPGTFAEVVGQDHVTEPICAALESGKIHHAYLFSGPRGCGKTSSARILARSLNCEKGPTSTPCGECDSCVSLAPNGPGSLDVIEIDAASHGLVDDARDLRERAFFAPVSSRFKIYVIDEAHMISSAAFNALLKVVEEPPPHVKFIFATTEPDKVLTTIKSRTFHYRFRLIPPAVMREHLAVLAKREGIDIDPQVLPLVVRAGAGSARDAQSILDQLAAGSGGDTITYERALSLLGYTDATLLDEVVEAFAEADGAAVFASVDRVVEAGLDPRRFAQDLLERFRDLLVLDAVPEAAEKGLLDVPLDALDRMTSQASRFGSAALSRAADVMATALVDMRGTTSPRLVLELACARVLLPGAASDVEALLARLDRMEKRLAVGGAVAPVVLPAAAATEPAAEAAAATEPVAEATAATEPAAAATEPAAAREDLGSVATEAPAPDESAVPAAEPGVVDISAVRRLWPDVLDAVKARSRTANALMMSSEIEGLAGETLSISFQPEVLAARFVGDVQDAVIGALKDVIGVELKVLALTGAGSARPTEPSSRPSAGESATEAATDNRDTEPDLDDSVDVTDEPTDSEDAALALLKEGLGAQVIGEIDQS